jgi:hypothetical protein
MSTREEKLKRLGPGIAIALFLIAIGIATLQLAGGRTNAVPVQKQAHYTDDNGKSFFADDVNKVVPFERGGKQAYRVDVFKGPDGKQFVGLIYRHTDGGKKEMQDYINRKVKDPDGGFREGIESRGMQVKRPVEADKAWTLADSAYVSSLRASTKTPSGVPAEYVAP